MAQYARGAREAVERIDADFRSALAYLNDSHEAVKRNPEYARDRIDDAINLLREIRAAVDDDILPRLVRAEGRAAERATIDALRERIERLEKGR